MIRLIFIMMCLGLFGAGGCTRVWNGPVVEPLKAGDGMVESGMFRGMPFVMASVNGSEPMKFLFDTGANLNVLTPEIAKKLGIKPIGKADVKGASGLTKRIPVSILDRVEFGPIVMSSMAFLIKDLGDLLPEHSKDIAGLIGIGGLKEFTIDIDYPNRQVAITNERLVFSNPNTTVLFFDESHLPWVPMRFVDPESPEHFRIVWGLLDTGNLGSLDLDKPSAGPLIVHEDATQGHRSMGIHGIEQISAIAPVRNGMMLGQTTLDGLSASINDVECRLGSDVLRNFRVKIDCKSNLVSFTRSDEAQRLVSIEKLGISNLWMLDGYRIDRVKDGSVAEHLGIRASDKVLLVDGQAPNELHNKTKFWSVPNEATTITVRIHRWSDDSGVDVVLPLDGSKEGLEKRERINEKPAKFDVEILMEDGPSGSGEMTIE